MIKKCKNCNKKFKTFKSLNGKYCSRECYLASRWEADKCKFCEKPITGKRYCNKKCRDSYWFKNEYQLLKKKRLWERKRELIKELGGKCIKCGINDERVLDIDHIDANKKIKVPKHKYTMSSRLVAWNKEKNNLRILCANCHRIRTWKQFDYGNINKIEKKNMLK